MKKLILIVDDDDLVRNVYVAGLLHHSQDLEFLLAENGESGYRTFVEHQRDIALIITDCEMRGMGGAEMITKIRLISPTVPIIANSGKTDCLEGAKAAGADCTLQKPVRLDILTGEVTRLLAH